MWWIVGAAIAVVVCVACVAWWVLGPEAEGEYEHARRQYYAGDRKAEAVEAIAGSESRYRELV